MLESAALAILVHVGASSWFALGVASACWLASAICQPYWSATDDRLEIVVSLTVFLACLAATLVEDKAVCEGEVWLAVVLNTVGGITLLALIVFIGRARLVRSAVKWYGARRRANIVEVGEESIEKMSEEGELFCILCC